MKLFGLVLAVVGMVTVVEGAAPPVETLDGLRKAYRAKRSSIRHPEDDKAARAWYSQRLLAFAKRNPKTDDAFTALTTCVAYRRSHIPKGSPAAEAVAILRKDYVEHKDMILKAHMLGEMADEGCAQLLRAVIARHPDRRTRAKACHALAKGRLRLAKLGNTVTPFTMSFLLGNGEKLRIHHQYQHVVSGTHGKEYTDLLVANARKYRAEGEAMSKLLAKDYPEMFPDLSIGKVAPEVISQDLDGKEVKVSAYRGKVVVLDIWATWCKPCRDMIPHEREMVKRLEEISERKLKGTFKDQAPPATLARRSQRTGRLRRAYNGAGPLSPKPAERQRHANCDPGRRPGRVCRATLCVCRRRGEGKSQAIAGGRREGVARDVGQAAEKGRRGEGHSRVAPGDPRPPDYRPRV